MTNVVGVSDSAVVRCGLTSMLSRFAPRIRFTAVSFDAFAALRDEGGIDVTVLDDGHGSVASTRRLRAFAVDRRCGTTLRYAPLSRTDAASDADALLASGCDAALDYRASADDIARAILGAADAAGAAAAPPAIVPAVAPWPGRDEGLSRRESHVMQLITRGLSNREICDELSVTINTVKGLIRSAYRELGIARRTEAVLWGARRGLIAPTRTAA